MKPVTAYPLVWPLGWRRTAAAQRAIPRFNTKQPVYREQVVDGAVRTVHSYNRSVAVSVAQSVQRILEELVRLGAEREDVLISTNIEVRLDGLPRSDRKAPADPGAAVYWKGNLDHARRCMAIDRYDSVAGNLAAIAATLEAMRAIERHGGAEILDRAFTGFTALPAPEQPWQVLGVPKDASEADVRTAYRALASKHHPDKGGDPQEMARINQANDTLMKRFS